MTETTPAPLYGASYRLGEALPATLICGEALLLDLELTNTGATPWLASGRHPVLLVYRWLDSAGAVAAEGPWRRLPAHVPPGMAWRSELRVESPPAPGDYRLTIELVEDGVTWLRDRGVAPFEAALAVVPPRGPRVAIINGNVISNDAVGSHVIAQVRALREAGYLTLLLTSFIDERIPRDLRRSMVTVGREQFADPDPTARPAVEHFRGADLVIVNYSTYYDLVELIREVRGAPVIFDYHGVTPPAIWGADRPGYSDLVRGVENLSLVRFADYAVAHSQYMCDELIATGCIAASRVSVQPYPVVERAAYLGPPDPELVAEHGLEGRRVLLYVGRMARNKRIHDLVEALPLILARHPDTALVLVGETGHAYAEYVEATLARAEELGVAGAVIFTGAKSRAEVARYYQLCDVFVMASVHEGFCMPVVEAMAGGRPVVAAAATALPSTIGDAGLLFPPEDPAALAAQVNRLLDDLPPPGAARDPLALHAVAPAGPDELAALREKTIAFVTPRYGPQILGGAETGLRSWAERLAAEGYRVEALTTCTLDFADWSRQREPGVEVINGVTARYFPSDPADPGQFHGVLQKAHRGERVTRADEVRFISQNVRSAALTRHLRAHADEYACAFFAPYLFGTSYWDPRAIPGKAIMVPCLHDEPAAYFAIFRETLEEAAAIFYNVDAEGEFARAKLGVASPYQISVGFGFDEPPAGDPARFRARFGLQGPILLYSGRLEQGKNVPLLIDHFISYKRARPESGLALVLTGTGSVAPPARADILAVGMLDDQTLRDAYAACAALCQPSLNESFSIVMMEAWLQGRPAIVHADCAVTRQHIEKSGGGLTFTDAASFAAALDALLADEAAAAELGERGRAYVRATYSWPVIVDKLLRGAAAFTRPRRLYSELAQRGIRRALDFTAARFEEHLLRLAATALADSPRAAPLRPDELRRRAHVARPGYSVRSGLPLVGRAVAWVRRQLTSHLKEPYLDPVIADQERFNRELIEALLPALEASQREQRQLRRELDALRERLAAAEGRDGKEE